MEQCSECKQIGEHKKWCHIGTPRMEKVERRAEKEIDEKYSEDLKIIKEAIKSLK